MRFPASLVSTALLGFAAPLARGDELPGLFETLAADGNFDTLVAAAISVDLESFLARFEGDLSKSVG
jgi:hypothetical protein